MISCLVQGNNLPHILYVLLLMSLCIMHLILYLFIYFIFFAVWQLVAASSSSSSSVPFPDAPRRPASINGLREVADVKVLLKQWVEHCGEFPPNQEDVERFASFLSDLCRERDLAAVDTLLKYFRR